MIWLANVQWSQTNSMSSKLPTMADLDLSNQINPTTQPGLTGYMMVHQETCYDAGKSGGSPPTVYLVFSQTRQASPVRAMHPEKSR